MKAIPLIIAVAMVTAAGCGAPAPSTPSSTNSSSQSSKSEPPPATPTPVPVQEVDRDTIYTVSVDTLTYISFDADGNVVQQESSEQKRVLNDLLTGEPRYQIHTKTTDTGEDYEYGSPITVSTTALYDMDGKLLYDYGKYTYGEAAGTLLVRKDHRGIWSDASDIPADFASELWDPTTDKSVLPKVATLTVLDKDKQLMAASDVFGDVLGTVDASGRMVKSLDNGYKAQVCGKRIIVCNVPRDNFDLIDEQYTMLNEELEPVATAEYIRGRQSWQDKGAFMYRDKDVQGLMDSDGKRICELSKSIVQSIDFFDGEMMVIRMVSGGTVLMKLDGTGITQQYDQIVPVCPDKYYITEPVTQYVVRNGSTVSLIDPQGKVLASSEVAGLSNIDSANGSYIIYNIENGLNGMLDMQLKVVIAADKYEDIYQQKQYSSDGSNINYDIIIAHYYSGNMEYGNRYTYMYKYDLYDGELNLIADSLSEVGTVGKGRIAVVRGFSAGVIDWQGNWIGKTSIFNSVSDERKVEIY